MKRTLMALFLLGGLALAQVDGAKLYQQCAGCHQANGQGIPGAFPPLAGHVAEILAKEGGRDYLILVLLYGLPAPGRGLSTAARNAWCGRPRFRFTGWAQPDSAPPRRNRVHDRRPVHP